MSGPATAAFSFGPLAAIGLAALALREAHKMGREYQDVLAEVRGRASNLADAQHQARQARCEQLNATRQRAARLQTQLERLRRQAGALGLADNEVQALCTTVAAQAPGVGERQAWQARLQALEAAVAALDGALAPLRAQASVAAAAALPAGELVPVEEALHAYMVQRALDAQLDSREAEQVRQTVARLLARLELEPGEPVPAELDGMAQAIALAPSLERAEALAMEMRLRIQQHQEQRAAHASEVAEARGLLDALGEDAPLALRQLLEAVLLGERLLPPTRELAAQALQARATLQRQADEAAAAEVLAQSLRDLGYAVEGVDDTFFVEGGVAHFQRHGWGEYFVRMRVGRQDQTLNFNVVRAKGAEESSERKRLDYLAEDRWCAEFPKLLETLAARGIKLDVQRLLGAGELPVQVVEPGSVPAAQDEQQRPAQAKLRELKP